MEGHSELLKEIKIAQLWCLSAVSAYDDYAGTLERLNCMLKDISIEKLWLTLKILSEYRDMIPTKVAKDIEAAMADLRKAICNENIDKIKAKIDAANKAVAKIREQV